MSKPRVTVAITTIEGIQLVHVRGDKWTALDKKGNPTKLPKAFWDRHKERGRAFGRGK